MSKKILLIPAVLAVGVVSALTVQEAEKFAVAKNTANSKIITFEEPEFKRKFKPGFSVVKEGINWTNALKVTKSHGNKIGPVGVFSIKTPKAGMRYRLSAYMRAEVPAEIKLKSNEKIQIIGVDHSNAGKWLGGSYANVPFPSREWKRYDIVEFSPKQYPSNMLIIAYLYAEYPATVWIDDIRLEALEPDPVAVLLKPHNLAFRNGEKIRFEFFGNESCPPGTKALISFGGVKKIAEFGRDGKLSCTFSEKFADGSYPFSLTVLDEKNRLKLKEFQYKIRIVNNSKKPANAAFIDQYGRLIVNDRPFMPVGFFGGSFNDELAGEFAANGINTVLFYGLIGERRWDDARRIAEMDRVMNIADKNDIKIIPCLIQQVPGHAALVDKFQGEKGIDVTTQKLVKYINKYPALLAWYIADETPVSQLHTITRIRENVSTADIWHPTYSITCRPEDFPLFGITGDIMGVDPYPVSADASGRAVDVGRCASWMIAAGKTGQPVWMIPQLTNLGNILFRNKPEEFKKKSRGPSADEFIAMPLIGAVYGAKGFISYSYFDMERSEKMQPGYLKKHMPDFYAATKLLRKAEPYIMGTKSRNVSDLQSSAAPGNIHAAILQADNGKECVIICHSGVSEAKAVFTVKNTKQKFKSEFGRIREIAPGKFEFKAKGVQADILFPAE